MKFLLDAIPDKPIYFEMRNQVRRASTGAFKGNQVATLIVVLVIFSMMAYSFLSSARYIPIGVTMFFLPALVSFVIPGVLGSVISGEVQKRSMEPLLAAPLTPFSLVKAKAYRAILPVLLSYAAVLVLIFLLLLGKAIGGDDSGTGMYNPWISFLAGTVIYFAYSYCVAGISMAVSAVTRSSVASLLTTYGVLIGIFVILPAIVMPIFLAISPDSAPYVVSLHPYGMLTLATFTDVGTNANFMAVFLISVGALVGYMIIGFMTMGFAANRLENFKKAGTGV